MRLAASVEGASERELDRLTEPGGDGVWSVRAHIHHAADVSVMGALRLRLMLAGVVLEYWEYEQAAFQRANRYERGVESSLALIAATAESACAILERLPADEWEVRRGLPDGRGFTAADWLGGAAAHLLEHAQVVERALGRKVLGGCGGCC